MKHAFFLWFFFLFSIGSLQPVHAKVDLVTLPNRESVQLTIYNSADLTLVKETRLLTLKKGINELQFSWANTLIDPTSIELIPLANSKEIAVFDLSYPPRVVNLGQWRIESQISGQVPVQITYLTSGLSWRAFYVGTLTADESGLELNGYVRVTNRSGEDYENAQTRLIVGNVNIIDRIATLAKRKYPYGRPIPEIDPRSRMETARRVKKAFAMAEDKAMAPAPAAARPKVIKKEALSEYFLYTIEGRETIPDNWSKRLPSFQAAGIPVKNLYKYDDYRFGPSPERFLLFVNDKDHKLGKTPIPNGRIMAFRTIDDQKHLAFEGASAMKYIPVGQSVELDLGQVNDVVVETTLMKLETDNYMFFKDGNIRSYDETQNVKVEVRNTRTVSAAVEVYRNIADNDWELEPRGAFDSYEKVDKNTVKFVLMLAPHSRKTFDYSLTIHFGQK
jgi:hypothetical protein